MKELATLIRTTREKHGLTQGQLAESCGWSRQRITNIERGKQNIQVAVLQKIADALNLQLQINFIDKRGASLHPE
jgi:transcriptional regulator with XRE-family HTH domain